MVGQQLQLFSGTFMMGTVIRRRAALLRSVINHAAGFGMFGMRRRRRTISMLSATISRSGSVPHLLSNMSVQWRLQQQRPQRRTLSSAATTEQQPEPERLRVAIVGGGCAGLSAALHLAPLVEAGLIASPIDIFDATPSSPATTATATAAAAASGCVGAGAIGRDIGVGIWSTALEPLRMASSSASSTSSSSLPRTSHELAYHEMTTHGTWVGDVGYRTIDGAWLMHSHLPTSREEMNKTGIPGLLFLRERDMLSSLQKAVAWEQDEHGTIRTHHQRTTTGTTAAASRQTNSSRIMRLEEDSVQPWSARLVFGIDMDGSCQYSERDYHLIVAADGTNSVLRKVYGGHDIATRNLLTGGAGSSLASPIELPHHHQQHQQQSSSSISGGGLSSNSTQEEAVGLQDRNYTVFRGNANITQEELLRKSGGVDGGGASFQTWGNGQSMRFATVPMLYPEDDTKNNINNKQERQVWFITIDNDEIAHEPDAYKRRDLLLEQFKDWHEPIKSLVMATPPEETLMERAIAHRHCMGPVLSLNRVVSMKHGRRPPNSGEGPCIVFLGDAYMTIDPILAQGFTVGMEGAHALRNTVENACIPSQQDPSLGFDPFLLRQELKLRHHTRLDRLVCLLRVTELVQLLGQPSGGTIGGFLNTHFLRPLTKMIPNAIKKPIFDAVLNYSLGLPRPSKVVMKQKQQRQQQQQQEQEKQS